MTEADTIAKLIDPQCYRVMRAEEVDRSELKKAFEVAANIREGYL